MSYLAWKSFGRPRRAARDRVYVMAAWALSFITSPSDPVMVTDPFPLTRDTSMNRISPPVGGQARPVATPPPAFSPSVPRGAPVLRPLPGEEELLGDRKLVEVRAPRDQDPLHPVLEGGRDGVDDVRRGDEHHLRQVERDVQVVVAEGEVRLGVGHLQKSRGGGPADGGAHLV